MHTVIDPYKNAFFVFEIGNLYPAIERQGIAGGGKFFLCENFIGTGFLAFKFIVVKAGHTELGHRHIPFFIQRHTIALYLRLRRKNGTQD